ncbi:PIN domain-containing protein [Kineococcus terrestris]|uniref:PIN domain-containing protein n=1 Tax=Kineococcus terrestris TaxID=2044856 RepID=UPI0034DB3019
MKFVLDNSVVQRFGKPRVRETVERLRADHELTVCVPTLLEVGVSARDAADHARQQRMLAAAMRVLEGSRDVDAAAQVIQGRLVARGQHRGPGPVDVLVAAHAVVEEAAVLHYDRDFELIEEHAGVPQRWVLPRGTADRG